VDYERGLNKAVNKLRDVLHDSADSPRFVETIPRRGYRFIAPLEGGSALTMASGSPVIVKAERQHKIWLAMGVAVTLVLIAAVGYGVYTQQTAPRIHSLAVLPFENLSGDLAQDYFSDGMTEALITELGKISALRVISRQSMIQFKNTKKTVPQIARELKVDAVVEGSVVRTGDRVRVSVQLIEAEPERHLWADSYDREMRDVLNLHSQIARTVAKQIKISLTPQEQTRLAESSAVNPTANESYLRGRYFLGRRDIDKALADFQQAVALDPSFAPAHASLAECYLALAMYNPSQETDLVAQAQAASLKALELDNSLSAAHYTVAALRAYAWDWSGAEVEYQRAIELNPSNASAHIWYSDLLTILGRFAEAQGEEQRAGELDPTSLVIQTAATGHLFYARRYDELISRCRDWVKLDPNLESNSHLLVRAAYVQIGRHEEAVTELRQALKSDPMSELPVTELANALAVAGKRQEALQVLERVKNVPWNTWGAALVHTGLGEKDEAFRSLERAIDLRAPLVILLKVDPRFDSLRQDSHFQNLLRRMNFTQ
jgi:TolB-like protein/Tfp pilus assembly protein PilF